MGTGRRAIVIVAAALAFALAAPARADLADDARTSALKKAGPSLEELGAWCGEQKLLRKRAAIGALLVAVDADHESARAWLQFKRDKRGDWVRPPGVASPADTRSDDWPEWVARRTQVLDPVRKALEDVCDAPRFAKSPGSERTLRLLIELYPEDVKLREKHGERRVAGRWVLEETAATADGRKRVETWVRDAMKAASAKAPVVERKVAGEEAHWACSAALENVYVATTGNAKEVEAFVTNLVAAERLVDLAMGRTAGERKPLRCDMFLNYWENHRYLEKCTELSAEDKKKYDDWRSWWREPERLVVWDNDPVDRIDDAVRQLIDHQRSRARRIWDAPAWLSEGLGLYLTWKLLGTRRTYFIQDTEYADQEIRKDMLKPNADWVALARKLAQKQGGTRLPILAGTPLNGLTAEDDVMAFAVAAYVVETRPQSVADLYEQAAASKSIEAALTASLGLDLESLDARFARWLEETR